MSIHTHANVDCHSYVNLGSDETDHGKVSMKLFFRLGKSFYPITMMFDIDGDETDDPEMAHQAVVQENPLSRMKVEVDEGDIVMRRGNGL